MEKLLLYIKCILATPLYPIFLLKNRNGILIKDLKQWENSLPVVRRKSRFLTFIRMFAIYKEYRNLFFHRIGGIGFLLKLIIPSMQTLNFVTASEYIGEGLVIQHGFSTIIWPQSIGCNCQIWQNVTIGRAKSFGGRPVIGNNVNICTGAIVIGDIKIGNNVTIGAGTVVVKDVPDNCVVVGNPTRIIKQNGEKTNIIL